MSRESTGNAKLSTLVEKLHSRTVSGEIEWQTTSIPDRYILQLPETGVAIHEIEERSLPFDDPSDLEKGYELTLLNGENKEIESFDILKYNRPELYTYAEEIFQYASTGYKDINQAIDAVINDIESMEESQSFELGDDLPF